MWGGGDRGSWTEGRYRWMVKAEEGGRRLWEKVQCSHVSADNLSLLQTNPFFSVVGIYLEIYDRDLRGVWEVNHRCLGYKVAFSFATATRESINEIEEEREWKTSNGKWKSSLFFFFSSRMNQTIERMGLSRSILRFYLRVIRSWRKMFRDEIRCLRETFFLCSEYICI